jgi:hypothetical protein
VRGRERTPVQKAALLGGIVFLLVARAFSSVAV